jgi:serine protease DegQ
MPVLPEQPNPLPCLARRRAGSLFTALVVLALAGCAAPPPAPSEPTASALTSGSPAGLLLSQSAGSLPSLAALMREVTPAVVSIAVESKSRDDNHPFMRDPEFRRFLDRIGVEPPDTAPEEKHNSMGSGIIVDAANGLVMTNDHLLSNATRITVTLKDRRSFRARRLGADPSTDVAILQIPSVNLRPLRFGNSDRLEVGDFVIAIGNPFGLGQTVTMGIVSAVGRSGVAGSHLGELIQTDASINPGNSGGPLINLSGDVVGINTALIGPTGGNVGIGFAVPSNRARAALRKVAGGR